MNWHRRRLACLTLALSLVGSGPALFGAPPEPRAPSPKDRCVVCGMLVAPHAAWLAQLRFESGSAAYFDGNRCLFRYLLAREKFAPELLKEKISATYITTYYDLGKIPLEHVFFVTGSDVKGPMGPELVPLRTRDEADEFLADHGGRQIVRPADVTHELLASLE